LTSVSDYQKLPGMDPASAIIKKLGGEAKVAEITGMAFTAPYRWQHDKSKGGTGGLIPQAHHRALLDYAHTNDIPLVAEEFLAPRLNQLSEAG
jgi:hypothetical protein